MPIIGEVPVGPTGPQGPVGPQGTPGAGVPTGGSTGQVLTKTSAADYATNWMTSTGGGITLRSVPVSTNYIAVHGDYVKVDASGTPVTIIVPNSNGAFVGVSKTDSSTNLVTVVTSSGTVSGDSSAQLTVQYASATFIGDGTNVMVVASYPATGPVGPQGPAGSTPNVQDFTSSGLWTKPPLAKIVEVIVISPGGGGGGGATVVAGTACSGGAGGSSGAITVSKYDAADLPASLGVGVALGGAGGLGAQASQGTPELLINPATVAGADPKAANDYQVGSIITANVDCIVTGVRFMAVRGNDGKAIVATIYNNTTHAVLATATRTQLATDTLNQFYTIPLATPLILTAGQVVAPVVYIPFVSSTTYAPYRSSPNNAAIPGTVTSIAAGSIYSFPVANSGPVWPTSGNSTSVGAFVDLVVGPFAYPNTAGGVGANGGGHCTFGNKAIARFGYGSFGGAINANSTTSGAAAGTGSFPGQNGTGGTNGAAGSTASASAPTCAGGPSGGGISAAGVAFAGGNGVYNHLGNTSIPVGGAAGGGNGAPANVGGKAVPGGSASGGGANVGGKGGDGGGSVGSWGAGGAGGGSATGGPGGNGGKGGDGFVRVITYF